MKHPCDTCNYVKECRDKFGEDFPAVLGTHHCRKSYDEFIDTMKPKRKDIYD